MERLPEPGPGQPGHPVPRGRRPGGPDDHLLQTSTRSTRSPRTRTPRPACRPRSIAAVQGKNLDGVNFDFEGEGSADQVGLTNLITKVSAALHATNPHWQVTMAVYGSAASDPGGFYNVAAVAPAIDAFFVMAYDMNSRTQPSATSPLVRSGLHRRPGHRPTSSRWCRPPRSCSGCRTTATTGRRPTGRRRASATGPESPLSDSAIVAANHPTYWDPVTDTPWTAYQVGTPVAQDLLRRPDVDGPQGPAGQLLPHRRRRDLGPRHGRQRPGHARPRCSATRRWPRTR